MRPRTYRRAMLLATFGAILAGATIGTGIMALVFAVILE
jgi:hypothetical protein